MAARPKNTSKQSTPKETANLRDRRTTPTFVVRLPMSLADAVDAKVKDEIASDRTKVVVAAVVKYLRETGYLKTPEPPMKTEQPDSQKG